MNHTRARWPRIVAALVGVIMLLAVGYATARPEHDPKADRALQCTVKEDRSVRLTMSDHKATSRRFTETLHRGFPVWVRHDSNGLPYAAVMPGGTGKGELRSTDDLDCSAAERLALTPKRRIVRLCSALPGAKPEVFAQTSIAAGRTVELAYPWGHVKNDRGVLERIVLVYATGQRDVYVRVVAAGAAPSSPWVEGERKRAYTLVTSPAAIYRAIAGCSGR